MSEKNREILRFGNDGFSHSFYMDTWEYPRCVNFVDSSENFLAKIDIPDAWNKAKDIRILEGNLTDDEKKEAINLLNSVRHGITCYNAINARLDMLEDEDFPYEL